MAKHVALLSLFSLLSFGTACTEFVPVEATDPMAELRLRADVLTNVERLVFVGERQGGGRFCAQVVAVKSARGSAFAPLSRLCVRTVRVALPGSARTACIPSLDSCCRGSSGLGWKRSAVGRCPHRSSAARCPDADPPGLSSGSDSSVCACAGGSATRGRAGEKAGEKNGRVSFT